MERPRISVGKHLTLAACFVALALAGPVAVHAGPAEDAEAAREHTKRATAAYNLGHYGEAAGEFETAYRLVQDPALLFNLAQARRLAGQLDQALTGYKSYLRTAPAGAGDRAQAEKWKQELERNPSAARESPTPAPAPASAPFTPPVTPPAAPGVSPAPVTSPAVLLPPVAPAPAPTASVQMVALPAPEAPPSETKPVYTRWWFWTIVGAAAVGVATALILARDEQNPDCLGISPCGSLR